MSRFGRVFLRDRLGGRVHLAVFGKHPAWDDHLGLLGAHTETLALLEDLLYRQGIGGQLAAGRWRDVQGEVRTPEFRHAFLWSRGGQSVVGMLWPSVDGKGRRQFPFVCCLQSQVAGAAAVQIYLDTVERLGRRAREAPSQADVRQWVELGTGDVNRWTPATPKVAPLPLRAGEIGQWRDALVSLAQGTVEPGRGRRPGTPAKEAVRVPSLDDQPSVRLAGYAAFLDGLSPTPSTYLLITRNDPASPVDCVLGEPEPEVFFCLGADGSDPSSILPTGSTVLPPRVHKAVDEFLSACATGALPLPRRSFWRWLRVPGAGRIAQRR